MASPEISILIAVFNSQKYLEGAIHSVLNQEFENWEIIIIDDGSSDNSFSIAQNFQDKRIKLFKNKKNEGCGYTKRKLIEYAKGEICGFLDSDDKLSKHALTVMIKEHYLNPDCCLIYSTHYVCDSQMNVIEISPYTGPIPENENQLITKGARISHFVTFKKTYYNQTSGINAKYKISEDQDLYYKLEETGKIKFLSQPLYYYRTHPDNTSLNDNRQKAYIQDLIASIEAYKRRRKKNIYPNLNKDEVLERRIKINKWKKSFALISRDYLSWFYFTFIFLILIITQKLFHEK